MNWFLWVFLLFILFVVLVRLPWVWWWSFVHKFYVLKLKDIDAAERKNQCQNVSEYDEATWEQKRQQTKIVIYGISSFLCFVYCITVAAAVFNISSDGKYMGIGAWGPVGDFFGGMLNPILAFASFIALLYTIRIQSEELRLTREEFQKSVQAQSDMALSQGTSVRIQSETANLNRSIAEFDYLSSTLREHIKSCTFLLYEYKIQTLKGPGKNVVVEDNFGLWYLYCNSIDEVKASFNGLVYLEQLIQQFKYRVDRVGLNVNVETLKREAVLIGKMIGQLENNEYFSKNAQSFILESQRVFIIVYMYFKETEFSGYSFDPKPYLDGAKITTS